MVHPLAKSRRIGGIPTTVPEALQFHFGWLASGMLVSVCYGTQIAFRQVTPEALWSTAPESYLRVHARHRSAWTWEVELRAWVETF
jgi:hypothetical protein